MFNHTTHPLGVLLSFYCIWWSRSHTTSFPKSSSSNPQPKKKQTIKELISLSVNWVLLQWIPVCSGVHTLVLQPHVFVCIRVCWLGGQREHYTYSVGARVQVKTLEHSFSGVLSYAQASFLGHMMNSSSVREDVVGRFNECVAVGKLVVSLAGSPPDSWPHVSLDKTLNTEPVAP